MNSLFKKIIAAVITISIFVLMYLGAYLPWRKSRIFVQTMLALRQGQIRSVQNFVGVFEKVFGFYSPAGQDEIMAHYSDVLINALKNQEEREAVEILIQQLEKWGEPLLAKKRGFLYNQNLFSFGQIYKMAALKFHDENYFQKSVAFFREGLNRSPRRFMFFAGLFEDYYLHNDREKVREIGELILRDWPEQEKVREVLNELNESAKK